MPYSFTDPAKVNSTVVAKKNKVFRQFSVDSIAILVWEIIHFKLKISYAQIIFSYFWVILSSFGNSAPDSECVTQTCYEHGQLYWSDLCCSLSHNLGYLANGCQLQTNNLFSGFSPPPIHFLINLAHVGFVLSKTFGMSYPCSHYQGCHNWSFFKSTSCNCYGFLHLDCHEFSLDKLSAKNYKF